MSPPRFLQLGRSVCRSDDRRGLLLGCGFKVPREKTIPLAVFISGRRVGRRRRKGGRASAWARRRRRKGQRGSLAPRSGHYHHHPQHHPTPPNISRRATRRILVADASPSLEVTDWQPRQQQQQQKPAERRAPRSNASGRKSIALASLLQQAAEYVRERRV